MYGNNFVTKLDRINKEDNVKLKGNQDQQLTKIKQLASFIKTPLGRLFLASFRK